MFLSLLRAGTGRIPALFRRKGCFEPPTSTHPKASASFTTSRPGMSARTASNVTHRTEFLAADSRSSRPAIYNTKLVRSTPRDRLALRRLGQSGRPHPAGENSSITCHSPGYGPPVVDTEGTGRGPTCHAQSARPGASDGVIDGFSPARQAALSASKSFGIFALFEGSPSYPRRRPHATMMTMKESLSVFFKREEGRGGINPNHGRTMDRADPGAGPMTGRAGRPRRGDGEA